ncbi:MAG: putative transport system permease protein, partial [Acidobacteriaceae bacterium]|nr:putative transport system permease protein [Acidobacteriaceae bacterium]
GGAAARTGCGSNGGQLCFAWSWRARRLVVTMEVNVRTLWNDVCFGCRTLLRSPGYTAVAVLVLGLGIGANTAVFSAAYAFLRKPTSLPEIDRVLMVLNHHEQRPASNWEAVAPADYLDWRSTNHSLEGLAAYRWGDLHLAGTGLRRKSAVSLPQQTSLTRFGYRLCSVARFSREKMRRARIRK